MSGQSKEDDEHLPEHTIAMRRALIYCQDLAVHISPFMAIKIDKNAAKVATTVPLQRQESLIRFWEQRKVVLQEFCRAQIDNNNNIKILHAADLNAVEFRKTFQIGNVPCLIRGLDETSFFCTLCSKWQSTGPNKVNRKWFLDHVGADTRVPVRFQSTTTSSELDVDGRAEECETREMNMSEWIELLDNHWSEEDDGDSTQHDRSNYYLKDWHLQSHLREQQQQQQQQRQRLPLQNEKRAEEEATEHSTNSTDFTSDGALYQVPPCFEFDLLNAFLTKFTTSGDYMFTYWGPKDSVTTLHTDVMNSFSWSFNVAGTKEWTFYPPKLSSSSTSNDCLLLDEMVVVQRTGECIFVPSGWAHKVRNLEETVSINHNWISTANIDQTWECMSLEIKAIAVELASWGMGADCWDARESMLRGCFGLDVTAFFLMILSRLIELLCEATTRKGEILDWQLQFDLSRLKEALLALLKTQPIESLRGRLAAVLGDQNSASRAIELANRVCVAFSSL